jgi:hypothetical protein
MARSRALKHTLSQLELAKDELDAYAPVTAKWYSRCKASLHTLVPGLIAVAPGLRVYVEEVLNSPALLRSAWLSVKARIDAPAEVSRIDELLGHEKVLLDFVAGDTVSTVVTKCLLENFPGSVLAANSKSDYPDLFLTTYDYSMLPPRLRDDREIGAAIRGKLRRPVRVPDGLEIKTSRDNASIDCHFPHPGTHLLLSFSTGDSRVVVDDILVAFLRRDDYRITTPRSKATTLKASFNRSPFVSVLNE